MKMNECDREGCTEQGTVRRLQKVSQVLSVWKDYCADHIPKGVNRE